MKKLTKLTALLAVLGSVFFAGCSDINAGNGTVYGGPAKEMREVTLNVTSDSKLISFQSQSNNAARSILPTAKVDSDLDFYLFYVTESGSIGVNDVPLSVDFVKTDEEGKKGDISIAIPKGNYVFELYAVAKDTPNMDKYSAVKAEALLMAKSPADIRYVDTVDFYMNAEGLTKKGNVALSLYAAGWDPKADEITGYTINAALKYLKKTNDGADHEAYSIVENSDKNILTTSTSKISSKIPDNDPPLVANYTATGIAPGTYMFELEFINATHPEIVYYWNDNITILPGETTTANVPVYPTIEADPKAPKDFVAGYIEDDDLANNEYYTIEFQWDGSEVTTENYYELEILDVEKQYASLNDTTSDDLEEPADVPDATTDDTAWKALPGATQTVPPVAPDGKEKSYTGLNFIGNPEIYVGGSLQRNQSWCQVKAAYGHRYAARIRSVVNKEAGFVSEWVYCDISAGVSADAGLGTADATGFTSKLMNRYKVTYVLNDGEFNPVETPVVYSYSFTPGKITASADPTAYWNIAAGAKSYFTPGTGVNLIDPEQAATSPTTAAPALEDSTGHKWTHWTLNGTDYNAPGSKVKPYTGFENITLYANYAVIGKVYLFDDNDYAIGTVAATPSLTSVESDPFHHYFVELSESGTHDLALTITPKTGIVYDQVKVILTTTAGVRAGTVEVAFDGTDYTATIDSTKYRTGLYRATIEAYTSVRPNAPYTAQITIKMND